MKLPRYLRPFNLYHLLGVENFSDLEAIKKGYRKIALKYHPDRLPDSKEATRKFQLCTEAYKILQDEKKRTAYDRTLGKWSRPSPYRSSELLFQRRQSFKRYYSPRSLVDPDFHRFVDECRANFQEFLNNPPKTGPRPRIHSMKTMEKEEFADFVEKGRTGFQVFLKNLPRVKNPKY